MSRYVILADFPFGSNILKAGSILDDAVGDPIATLKGDGAPLVLATTALEALATAMAASALGSDNRHVGVGLQQQVLRIVETDWEKEAADVAAATVTAERPIYRAARPCVVLSVFFLPGAALVADNANNAVLRVQRRDGVGGAPVTVATYTTNVASGGLVAQVSKSLGAITNPAMAVGEVLTFEITKPGTGVIVPAGTLMVVLALD